MKLRIIEAALLMVIIVVVSGCDSDCLDFDLQLRHLFGLETYIVCMQLGPNTYVPTEISFAAPNSVSTFSPATAFDCGTSQNGDAPLPHPKSMAAIPPAGGGIPPASTPPRPKMPSQSITRAAQTVYNVFGFNGGYVPPGVVNPNIPIPGITSTATSPPACANSADVLIVNHLHNSLTRLGSCPLSLKASMPMASRPLQVAVTPDGTTALVTSFDNAVNFVNLANNSVSTLATSPFVNPAGIAISPDGKRAYVTSFNNSNAAIQIIDIATRTIVGTMPSQAYPQGIFLTPDGTQAWVTYPLSNMIGVYDTLTNTQSVTRSISNPTAVAFNPTGTRAYITSAGSTGALVVFNTATLKQLASYAVGAYPTDVRLTAGGRFAVVTNFSSGNLSVVDVGSGASTTYPLSGASTINGLVQVQ